MKKLKLLTILVFFILTIFSLTMFVIDFFEYSVLSVDTENYLSEDTEIGKWFLIRDIEDNDIRKGMWLLVEMDSQNPGRDVGIIQVDSFKGSGMFFSINSTLFQQSTYAQPSHLFIFESQIFGEVIREVPEALGRPLYYAFIDINSSANVIIVVFLSTLAVTILSYRRSKEEIEHQMLTHSNNLINR